MDPISYCAYSKCDRALVDDFEICEECRESWYCSSECMNRDWYGHKSDCKPSDPAWAKSKYLRADRYYRKFALKDKAFSKLLEWIKTPKLEHIYQYDRRVIMRRLVLLGIDSKCTIELCFGPKESLFEKWPHKMARIEVFLKPEPGSPTQKFIENADGDLDFTDRQPRNITDREEYYVERINSGQQIIQRHAQIKGVAIADVDLGELQRSIRNLIPEDTVLLPLAREAMDHRQPQEIHEQST